MSESISTIGGVSRTTAVEQIRSQESARLFQKVDANQNGRITADEFTQAAEAHAKQTSGQSGAQLPNPAELFKQLDQGNKGYLTQQDLETGLAQANRNRPADSPPPERAAAPTANSPSDPGSDDLSTTGTSSSIAGTKPEDLNQDGNVTLQEKIRYVLNQYAPIPEPPKQPDQTSLFG